MITFKFLCHVRFANSTRKNVIFIVNEVGIGTLSYAKSMIGISNGP